MIAQVQLNTITPRAEGLGKMPSGGADAGFVRFVLQKMESMTAEASGGMIVSPEDTEIAGEDEIIPLPDGGKEELAAAFNPLDLLKPRQSDDGMGRMTADNAWIQGLLQNALYQSMMPGVAEGDLASGGLVGEPAVLPAENSIPGIAKEAGEELTEWMDDLAASIVSILEGYNLTGQKEDMEAVMEQLQQALAAFISPDTPEAATPQMPVAETPTAFAEGRISSVDFLARMPQDTRSLGWEQAVVEKVMDFLQVRPCPLENVNDILAGISNQNAGKDAAFAVSGLADRGLFPAEGEMISAAFMQADSDTRTAAAEGVNTATAEAFFGKLRQAVVNAFSASAGEADMTDKSSQGEPVSLNINAAQRPPVLTPEFVNAEQAVKTENAQMADNLMRQVLESVTSSVKDGAQQLEIQLKPEHLGRLSLQLAMGESGLVAKIITANSEVQGAIAQQMTALRESLRERGIEVVSMDVVYEQTGQMTGESRRQAQYESGRSSKDSAPVSRIRETGIAYETYAGAEAVISLDPEISSVEYRA